MSQKGDSTIVKLEQPDVGLIPSQACWKSSQRGCWSQKIAGTSASGPHGTCNHCVTLEMIKIKMMAVMLMVVTSTSTPIVGLESLLTKSVVHIPFLLVAQHLNTQVVKIAQFPPVCVATPSPHLISISNILFYCNFKIFHHYRRHRLHLKDTSSSSSPSGTVTIREFLKFIGSDVSPAKEIC